MEVLFILLPATLLIAGLFVGLFILSVRKGQFEELGSPANRALFEDKIVNSNDLEKQRDLKGIGNGSDEKLR